MDKLMEGRTVFVIAIGFQQSKTQMQSWYLKMVESLNVEIMMSY